MSTEESWYYTIGTGEPAGPVSTGELADLITKGSLGAGDKVAPLGSREWVAVADSPFGDQLPPSSAPPPVPPEPSGPPALAAPSGDSKPNALLEELKDLGCMLPVFAKRAFSANFHGELATETEQARLAKAATPVTDQALVNFLAWRRSVLGLGMILMILAFLFAIPQLVTSFDTPNTPAFVHLTTVIFIFAALITIALIAGALLTWSRYRLSRLFSRLAFVTGFLVPFGVYLIPVRWFVSSTDQLGTTGWAALAGLSYAASLLPLVISVFPAFLRSALVMKWLVPESTLPGWIALMIAPFNALFFLIGLVVAMQMGSFGGILAFTALTAAPLVVLAFILPLIRPADPKDARKTLNAVRLGLLVCYVAAIVGIGILLASWQNATFSGLAQTVFSIIANVLVFNVVFGDYFLNLIRFSFQEEERLRGGDLHASLRDRIEQTSQLQAGGREAEEA